MISSKWLFGCDSLLPGLREDDPFDAFDEKSMQLLILDDGVPAACGSLYFDNGAYHLAHLHVRKDLRGRFLGDLTMRMLLVRALKMTAERIEAAVPAEAEGFFKKYGFVREGGVMAVTPETVTMSSACGHDCSACANREKCHES